jgi:hypothetical protein
MPLRWQNKAAMALEKDQSESLERKSCGLELAL